jgi:hypothetical protein
VRPAPAILVVLIAWTVAAAPAAAKVRVTSAPPLYPPFERGVSDYVVRCAPGEPMVLKVKATAGDRVSVAGDPPRGGEFERRARRAEGAAVALTARFAGARRRTYHVRCLPGDFPDWTASRRGKPQAGWYVVTPIGPRVSGYAAIFDSHGVPVWWKHSADYGPWDAKLLPGRHVAWTRYLGDRFGVRPEHLYEEHRLDGSLVRTIHAVGNPTDTHDLQRMPNGHYLVLAYRKRRGVDLSKFGGPRDGAVWDGEIQELTADGKQVWRWSSKDHIELEEAGRWWEDQLRSQSKEPPAERAYDLVHLNSVEPDGDGFVVSARHLDAVFRIDGRSGRVEWKLGGTRRAESLDVKDDPRSAAPLGGQHDARLRGDGTLTVYDNGTNLGRPPRAVRYRVDAKKRTATLVEAVHTDDVPESGFAGGTRKLRGGNWVTCWGGSALVTEQRPSGRTVLSLYFRDSHYSYRAIGVPRDGLSAPALRRAMKRMARFQAVARWR